MKIRFVLAIMVPVTAFAQTIACPRVLPEKSVAVPNPPPGWTVSSTGSARLDGGGMLSGDPKLMQYLVPTSSKNAKSGGSSTWKFDAGEEKWFFCTYGRGAVELSKRMGDKATTCELSSRRDQAGGLVDITAVCR